MSKDTREPVSIKPHSQVYNHNLLFNFQPGVQQIEARINVPFRVKRMVFHPPKHNLAPVDHIANGEISVEIANAVAQTAVAVAKVADAVNLGVGAAAVPVAAAAAAATAAADNAADAMTAFNAAVAANAAIADNYLISSSLNRGSVIGFLDCRQRGLAESQLPIIVSVEDPMSINGMHNFIVRSFTEVAGGAATDLTARVWQMIEFHEG